MTGARTLPWHAPGSFLATTLGVCAALSLTMLSTETATAHPGRPKLTTTGPGYADEQMLFESGTLGYSCFRIPAVVRTKAGTLLAFAEGRVNDCGDAGDIDLVMRRSTDGGKTWGPLQVLIEGNGHTRGNPAPVVDYESGRISLLSTYNPGDNPNHRVPYLQHSEDDGLTWTDPVDVSDQISKPEWLWWYGTGPVHGIQLHHGPHAGRLVVPCYYGTGTGQPGGVVLAYSDDGGLTWQRGATDERPDTVLRPGESTAVELPDGRILVLAREQGSTPEPGNRAVAVSSDGGETFDAPFVTQHDLSMPMVQASVLSAYDRLLFSAPAHPGAREVMAIRASYDGGESWQTWQEGKVIWWGPAGYSDLVRIDDRLTGLAYEAGVDWAYESIRWIRFDEEFLASPNGDPPGIPDPPEPGPTTKDASRHTHIAYVRGDAGFGAGRVGNALDLDGVDDWVEVPYADTLDLGNGDFTWSAWFRYSATTGDHALIWAYRMGSNTTPQVWLRAEPRANRIRALIGTDLDWGSAIASSGSYNDGAWHHVAVRRDGARFSLWIDGAEVAVRNLSGPYGSVTIGKEFGIHGIHIGQRVDGANRFHGSIDEVRIYTRALSAVEISRLASGREVGKRRLVLHLPFENAS